MRGRRRSKSELARDRRRIADLYLQGWTQTAIANKIGIHQPAVSRDLKALQKAWLASALIDLNNAKAKELAKVDKLEREYWVAWERSYEDAETVKQRGSPATAGAGIKPESIEKTVKGQAGDPRFLAGVQWCIERRCKIIGIDAPTNIDLSSGGEPIKIREVIVELPMEKKTDGEQVACGALLD